MCARSVFLATHVVLLAVAACRVDAPPSGGGGSTLDGPAPADRPGPPLDAAVSSRPIDGPPAPPPPPLPPEDPPDAAPEPDAEPDAPPVAPSGLLGHWRFDEAGGTLASDSSGSGNDGTLGPGATFVASGFPGALFANAGAVDLDGIEGRVVLTVNRLPPVEGSKSISFWTSFPAVPSDIQAMVSLTNGLALCGVQIGFRSGQLAVWGWAGALLASAPSPSPGWHNVIYTFDGFTHALILDGATQSTTTEPPQSCLISDAVVSGYAGGAENFLGAIDDLRIYDRALTPAEIATLAAGGQP
jgi:hypothetical protein